MSDTTQNDALVEQVADICTAAYLTGYHQQKYKSFNAKEDAEKIIALVRADERQNHVDALLAGARVVEVSDMGGGYALIRIPLDAPQGVRVGPVNVDALRTAIGITVEAQS